MSGKAEQLIAFIAGLLDTNRRLRDCVRAVRADRAGTMRRWEVEAICNRVTAEDLGHD